VLFILVTVLHLIATGLLITFILLHAGRGGGLSDMFGGGMSLGGSTLAEKNLDRFTVFAASLFLVTTVSLGFLISDRDRAPEPSPSVPTTIPTDLPTDLPTGEVTPTGSDTEPTPTSS
jgi:preprotein translocase subunit SecG